MFCKNVLRLKKIMWNRGKKKWIDYDFDKNLGSFSKFLSIGNSLDKFRIDILFAIKVCQFHN